MVADALSHPTDTSPSHFFILSMPRFLFLDKLRQSLQDSLEFVSLLANVRSNPISFPHHNIHNDLLLYDGKIWLNQNNPFIPLLLEEYHTTSLGGHMGLSKTLTRIQGKCFWKGMRSIVHTFVSQCSTCQQTMKLRNQLVYYSPLHFLMTPGKISFLISSRDYLLPWVIL